jgi:hypothetical protein
LEITESEGLKCNYCFRVFLSSMRKYCF